MAYSKFWGAHLLPRAKEIHAYPVTYRRHSSALSNMTMTKKSATIVTRLAYAGPRTAENDLSTRSSNLKAMSHKAVSVNVFH